MSGRRLDNIAEEHFSIRSVRSSEANSPTDPEIKISTSYTRSARTSTARKRKREFKLAIEFCIAFEIMLYNSKDEILSASEAKRW